MKTFIHASAIDSPIGFTLLETLVALAILSVAMLGAFAGVIYASTDLRQGQIRQYKVLLLEAKSQRVTLSDKIVLLSQAQVPPTQPPDQTAVGSAPWQVDRSAIVSDDLATGSYFTILPNGDIQQLSLGGSSVPCNDSSLPDGTYCRELLLTQGLPPGGSALLPAPARSFTQWIRVSRKGEPLAAAVVQRKVIVQ